MNESSGTGKPPVTRPPLLGEALERATSRADVAFAKASSAQADVRTRYEKLTNTLEREVIPRLVEAHGAQPDESAGPRLQPDEIDRFVQLLIRGSDAELNAAVDALYGRGLRIQQIYLQLFTPAARHLGTLWDADRCDFPTVTICLGRLQRLLRDWSPVFNQEIRPAPNGRKVLLAQHSQEQHSFGLSMVAEFFRAEGWEVLGGVAGAVPDIADRVSRERFDALGISAGTDMRVDWVREQVIRARAASRNRHLVVLVGGPIFLVKPSLAGVIGADAACEDGSVAPSMVDELMAARARLC
jgi:MerR family transcriptional regulator, light-induced transcriptional regulator